MLADRLDRRRVVRWCEAALGVCALLLLADSLLSQPLLWPLYVVAAAMNALAALQRPSVEAAIPRVVPPERLPAAVTLLSGTQNLNVIGGSSLGGVLAAGPGPAVVYGLDAASFAVSFALLMLLRPVPAPDAGEHPPASGLRGVLAGARWPARPRRDFLWSRAVFSAWARSAWSAWPFPPSPATWPRPFPEKLLRVIVNPCLGHFEY